MLRKIHVAIRFSQIFVRIKDASFISALAFCIVLKLFANHGNYLDLLFSIVRSKNAVFNNDVFAI
jgi:hypothetical protein